MNKYVINKPVQIATNEEDKYILSLPKEQVKIEINRNVLEFIEYLSEKSPFDVCIIDDFLSKNDATNKEDYIDLFQLFVDERLIVLD